MGYQIFMRRLADAYVVVQWLPDPSPRMRGPVDEANCMSTCRRNQEISTYTRILLSRGQGGTQLKVAL